MNRPSSSSEQPPDKRRRTELNLQPKETSKTATNRFVQPRDSTIKEIANDDLWDDDGLELTNDQLRHIDEEVMLSQSQATVAREETQQGPSHVLGHSSIRSSSSSSNVPLRVGQARTEQSLYKSQQTVSVPHKPKGFPRSMSSEFPKAQSSYSSASGSSGVYGGTQARDIKTGHIKDRMTFPSSKATGAGGSSTGTDSFKKENDDLKKEIMSKEGEIKNLRRILEETNSKLAQEGQKRVELLDQKSKDMIEKEKQLQKEIQSLNTQILFKDQEIGDLEREVKRKERQASEKSQKQNCATCSREVEVSNSPLRPILAARRESSKSSPKPGFGPSEKVFFSSLSEEQGSKSSSPKVMKVADLPKRKDSALSVAKKNEKRGSLSNFDCKVGGVHGSHVVAKLMPSVCVPEPEDHHLVGFHPTLPQISDVAGPRRDNNNIAVLDPSRIRKWIHSSGTDAETGRAFCLDYQQELATHAIKELLDHQKIQPPTDGHSSRAQPAVLILPILDSYLSLYLDMIQSGSDRTSGSSATSSSRSYSSSLDTYSVDSVNSQLRDRIQDYSSNAHLIERFALNSVSLLYTLVENCEEVRLALMEERKDMACPSQQALYNEVDNNVTDNNDNRCQNASPVLDTLNERAVMKDVQTFTTLIHLANPTHRNVQQNAFYIVEAVLRVLACLAEGCLPVHIKKFEALLRQDIILTLLVEDLLWSSEQRLRCQLVLLRLITAMTRSPDTLYKLHTDSEECIMRATCSLILSPGSSDIQAKLTIGQKLLQLVVTTISLCPGGVPALLKPDCQCGGDVTKAVVQLLHLALHEYRADPSQDTQTLLCQGVGLLNQLSVKDKLFKFHKGQMQHMYVEAIIGLDALFKESSDLDIFLEEAVQNLWDFDQEYPGIHENGAGSEEGMDIQ